jgi:hypothetical protein
LDEELGAWQGRFDEWVAAEGEDLGLRIQKPRPEEKK